MTVDHAKVAALSTLWKNVEAALDDDEVHRKFVRFAVDNELYRPAIERYKALMARAPEREAQARKWQKAIADQAAAKVFARVPGGADRAAEARQKRNRVIVAVMAICLAGLTLRIACAI